MRRRHVAAVPVAVAILGVVAAVQWARTPDPPSDADEFLPTCSATLDYPCVMEEDGQLYVVRPIGPDEATAVPVAACLQEDGPAPCLWDSLTRGDHTAGPIQRYVMIKSAK